MTETIAALVKHNHSFALPFLRKSNGQMHLLALTYPQFSPKRLKERDAILSHGADQLPSR
jgi:hypothetical protein